MQTSFSSGKACMRHGLTQPSRPHSSNFPEGKRVRKIQEYDAARSPTSSPRPPQRINTTRRRTQLQETY
ncbi:hypothetical protein SCLCIDRAFT_1219019 [Scleroderma citrinum Foug A]|uniref:Uncharacterized protein n=1 Tax=Scleroderma citrinum Foug A TaxID=1036808 RepID=A0A0C2ZZV5_9AGAM|nr:hypothetical protein SCLCIDRAFT_1219019 [Scleroderma citrinum Foug A]